MSVLKINSLYKQFGKKEVVRGVDFSMQTGEVLGLLGPNGAGKTTSFYMIVGFYRPTRGEVFLNDTCITRLPMYKRARMGISYLPQEASVFRKLTVEQNIWAVLETRKDLTKAEKQYKLDVFAFMEKGLKLLMESKELRVKISMAMRTLVDGNGAGRLAEALLNL